jgi:hypothetical protein
MPFASSRFWNTKPSSGPAPSSSFTRALASTVCARASASAPGTSIPGSQYR